MSSFLIMSTMCGRPSRTLLAERQAMPASLIALAEPELATSWKPGAAGRPVGGARLGDHLDARRAEPPGKRHRRRLVALTDADQANAARRQHDPGGKLRL